MRVTQQQPVSHKRVKSSAIPKNFYMTLLKRVSIIVTIVSTCDDALKFSRKKKKKKVVVKVLRVASVWLLVGFNSVETWQLYFQSTIEKRNNQSNNEQRTTQPK